MRSWHRMFAMSIDLNKLRHVVEVAREGSYTSASVSLPLSQSALTRSIQSTEREYRVRIFERGKFGVKLTDAGADFVAAAESLLSSSERADDALHMIAAQSRRSRVRIGVGTLTAVAFLPVLLAEFIETRHAVQVVTVADMRIGSMLKHGDLDLYVGGVSRDSDNFTTARGLLSHRMGGAPLHLLVRRGHPLLESDMSADVVSQYPVVCATVLLDSLRIENLDMLGFQRPSIESNDYGLLCGLAQVRDCIVVASEMVVRLRPDLALTVLPVDVPVSENMTWVVQWSSERALSDAASEVRELIRKSLTVALAHEADAYEPAQNALAFPAEG